MLRRNGHEYYGKTIRRELFWIYLADKTTILQIQTWWSTTRENKLKELVTNPGRKSWRILVVLFWCSKMLDQLPWKGSPWRLQLPYKGFEKGFISVVTVWMVVTLCSTDQSCVSPATYTPATFSLFLLYYRYLFSFPTLLNFRYQNPATSSWVAE